MNIAEILPGAKGRNVDKSYVAPTELKSKKIESFRTYFFLWDQFNLADEGSYSFNVKKNDSGEYILSEDAHYKLSVTVEKSVLDKLQKIIDDNSLALHNGVNEYTNGLPAEFAPCLFSAVYDTGEKLYFSEDNNPEAKWARAVRDLFKEEFIRQGHDELLPPAEDITLVRFDMDYLDENGRVCYSTIFTEEDTEEVSGHYLISGRSVDSEELEYDEILAIPGNFYDDLSEVLNNHNLKSYQNGMISPPGSTKDAGHAFFCMEMQSGIQVNAYYSDKEAEELIGVLRKVKEYIDSRFTE